MPLPPCAASPVEHVPKLTSLSHNHNRTSQILDAAKRSSISCHKVPPSTRYPRLEAKDAETYNTENREFASAETSLPSYQDWNHDLRGLGAQFESHSHASEISLQKVDLYDTAPCPYHQALSEVYQGSVGPRGGAGGLGSYLDGNIAQQYALYYREDTNVLSTTRNCNCSSKVSNSCLLK